MTFLEEVWFWLSNEENQNTVALLAGGLAGVVSMFWLGYVLFVREEMSDEQPELVVDKKFDGISSEQHAAGLKQRERDIQAGLNQTGTVDKAMYTLLEKQLSHVQAKLNHRRAALEESKVRLAAAYGALDHFDDEALQEQIRRAQTDLCKGDTGGAEDMFRQMLARGGAKAAEAAFQLGQLAYDRVDYQTAAACYEEATALQPDNPLYLNQAGFLVKLLGRYAEAEPFYRRALSIREKSLGPNHPAVAQMLNNLAGLSYEQGHYAQAEPLLQKSLAIREKALGPQHPTVASALENYAALLRKLGRTQEAERMEARAQAIWGKD